jgi:hypothetical protein
VRDELEKQDKSELKIVSLLPVLGTLVREGGNGMEEALARIRTVRGRTFLYLFFGFDFCQKLSLYNLILPSVKYKFLSL